MYRFNRNYKRQRSQHRYERPQPGDAPAPAPADPSPPLWKAFHYGIGLSEDETARLWRIMSQEPSSQCQAAMATFADFDVTDRDTLFDRFAACMPAKLYMETLEAIVVRHLDLRRFITKIQDLALTRWVQADGTWRRSSAA